MVSRVKRVIARSAGDAPGDEASELIGVAARVVCDRDDSVVGLVVGDLGLVESADRDQEVERDLAVDRRDQPHASEVVIDPPFHCRCAVDAGQVDLVQDHSARRTSSSPASAAQASPCGSNKMEYSASCTTEPGCAVGMTIPSRKCVHGHSGLVARRAEIQIRNPFDQPTRASSSFGSSPK
jgi:hypothetical protein